MPTYEYKCPKCGNDFEEFQKMSARPVAKCPRCGAKAERQMSGGAGLVFKGSGFYLTDYGRSGQQRPATQEGGEKSEKSEKGGKGEKPVKSDAPASTAKPSQKKDH